MNRVRVAAVVGAALAAVAVLSACGGGGRARELNLLKREAVATVPVDGATGERTFSNREHGSAGNQSLASYTRQLTFAGDADQRRAEAAVRAAALADHWQVDPVASQTGRFVKEVDGDRLTLSVTTDAADGQPRLTLVLVDSRFHGG